MMDKRLIPEAYAFIQNHFVKTGRAPHFVELAANLEITPDDGRELQEMAANAGIGCWISHDTDYISSWAPFSNIPTQYQVTIRGEQRWYGQ